MPPNPAPQRAPNMEPAPLRPELIFNPALGPLIQRKPKNILIISSIFHPYTFGGAEIAAYNRAKMLVSRGYNVSVVTLQEKDAVPSWGEVTPDGFKIYRLKTPRKYTLFERTRENLPARKMLWHIQDYFDQRNKKLISKVLDSVNPDYVEIDNLVGIGFNALSEIAQRDTPVSYILHDLNLACFNTGMIRKGETCKQQCQACRGVASLRQNPLNKIKRLGFISPSRANLERAKKFVPAISKSLNTVIRNVPEELPPLPERKQADHIRLLFVGRIDPVKGTELLLQTLSPLSETYNFHLTVMGAGPSEKTLKEKFGNEKWVTFRGFVPKSEVATALMESDLYCIPSLVIESYGLVTAQALQLGTPVIGSNTGGTAELVRDGVTGMLVPPGDKAAWQNAFGKILANPDLLTEWHKNTLAHAHEFDKDAIGDAHEKFITQLCSQRQVKKSKMRGPHD